MDETIAALEAEITRMQQTIDVVRTLKPIQRQQDQCMDLLRGHVANLSRTVAPPSTGAADPAKAGQSGEDNNEQQQQTG